MPVFLLIAVGGIAVEAIDRIREPAAVAGWTVVVVAAIGIAVNGATALLFMRGRHGDLNIRATFLHMMADAGVSLGVVVAALRHHAPPAGSGSIRQSACALQSLILVSGWGLARDSVNLALDGVPKGIDLSGSDGLSRRARGRDRGA